MSEPSPKMYSCNFSIKNPKSNLIVGKLINPEEVRNFEYVWLNSN
jgi:hypothetical protein